MWRFSVLLCSSIWVGAAPYADTLNAYFERVKQDPNALTSFLKAMPKGGELHYHLAGGAYPETMLEIASKENYCIKPETMTLIPKTSQAEGVCANATLPVAAFLEKPQHFSSLIQAWSMKDFFSRKESAHDHFFNSFEKFMPIVVEHSPALLAEVMQRAADQHEQYLEIMILPDNASSLRFAPSVSAHASTLSQLPKTASNRDMRKLPIPLEQQPRASAQLSSPLNLESLKQHYLKEVDFQRNIQHAVENTDRLLADTRHLLHCEDDANQPVCQLTVKFQFYVLREQPLEKIFVQALTAFEAVSRSKALVGVNLVQPEDGPLSLQGYHDQMVLFAFLHKAYPQVPFALHAGELAMGQVVPVHLQSHIDEAINIAGAQRIGHGVDIAYESNAQDILKAMAQKKIAIEINLTSNATILGVSKHQHPLHYYLNNNVPVVLSTDDEGILRTDLTQEYIRAALEQGLSYGALKQINRNALTYSFMPGKSLWVNPNLAERVRECHDLNSASCLAFIKTNDKARLQWQLENKLRAFEAKLPL